MLDPGAILAQASRGGARPGWAVFTKRRGRIRGFVRGTADDPDPLLVITPDGAVEFVDHRKGTHVLDFDHLSDVTLQVRGSSFSDSSIVHLDVWLDVTFRDGGRQRWRSSTFADDHRTIQGVLEAYGAYKALRGFR